MMILLTITVLLNIGLTILLCITIGKFNKGLTSFVDKIKHGFQALENERVKTFEKSITKINETVSLGNEIIKHILDSTKRKLLVKKIKDERKTQEELGLDVTSLNLTIEYLSTFDTPNETDIKKHDMLNMAVNDIDKLYLTYNIT